MLLGINPLLNGELLHILDEMGHGDQLLLVDRNYPAAASGQPVIRLGDSSIEEVATAILSVFPLDTFVEHPLERMEVDNDPSILTDAADEFLGIARRQLGADIDYGVVPRLDFYQRARTAFAVVHTLDARPYGCFILTKGVVNNSR